MNTRVQICWLLLGIFLIPLSARGALADIMISEIGAFEKSGEEWVELYNRAERSLSIEGWKFIEDFSSQKPQGVAHKLRVFQGDFVLEAHEYAIIAQDADLFQKNHPGFFGTIIDSSWSSLKQAGERLELKDQNGVVVEFFSYPASSSKTSLQRVRADQGAQSGDEVSWQSHQSSHSAGEPNVFSEALKALPKALDGAPKSTEAKKEALSTLPKNALKETQIIDPHIEKQKGVLLKPALSFAKFAAPTGPWNKIVYQEMPRSLPARDERSPLLKKFGAVIAITALFLAVSRRKRGKRVA